MALATILFYWPMLFGSQASIHWDLADVSYPAQKYFADSLHGGKLPQWSPYLESGIPFLSDPRTGAWYPLHWPFFLIGITPRALAWELAVHAFLAFAGAYLLARKLFGTPGPAIVGAMLYGWGGYFAAHSSHLPIFEAAALLPWLLWAALGFLETASTRWLAGNSLIGGCIVLAGHSASSLECLLALGLFAAAVKAPGARKIAVVALVAICAFLLAGVQALPAIELSRYSGHPDASMVALRPGTLGTLISADYYNLISGLYSGPDDLREHYLYSGLLLLPLAIAGLARREKILAPLVLVVPALWFAFGRPLGLYLLFSQSPGIRGSAPVEIWFVAALGLALLAASGAAWAVGRTGRPLVWIALAILSAADLWFWNMYKNPLAYARASYADLYGKPLEDSEKLVTSAKKRPFYRLWSPYIPFSGPADGSLLSRTEVAYGTGLGELNRYSAYTHAVASNPKLLNGLGITDLVGGPREQLVSNSGSLGRVSVPARVNFVPSEAAALAALPMLDPAQSAVAEGPTRTLAQSVSAIQILNYQDDSYRIRYTASGDSLIRIAAPYYPGWTTGIDGNQNEGTILPVDEALIGVIVPAGEHELTLEFHSPSFRIGIVLSLLGVIAIAIGLILPSAFRPSIR